MFVEVPEPVWKTSIGNWPSCLPAAISFAARSIERALPFGSSPSSPFTAAAAPFRRASQRTTSIGTVSPEIGKFSTALLVSPPHSCFAFGIFSPDRLARPAAWAARRGGGAGRGSAGGTRTLSAEGGKLARQPDGIVVGHQEARA